ncbi:Imm52 family immunity protein [Pseudomonas sp.]|uniref:Imm52 family immunity protein n=1 Tax=Pseudomonas sp. TaxID=306 RepID=UPI003D0CD36F
MGVEFVGFELFFRFDPVRIAAVSRQEQLQRSLRFFERMAAASPLLANWYRGGGSIADGLRFNVMENPRYLHDEADQWADQEDPQRVKYVLWNGEPDIFKGGLSLSYDAMTHPVSCGMCIEDIGGLLRVLPDPTATIKAVMLAAVELWPEITWAVAVPQDHYLFRRVFKDRQSIGWIGFCPHSLSAADLPDAETVVEIPQRGTLVVTCPGVMNDQDRTHVQRVADTDIRLLERGYLPLFAG